MHDDKGDNAVKVKENMGDGRGRPRKFEPGEETRWGLRIPENLLMEIRMSARIRGNSINDEILSRLMESLNYEPKKQLIKTEEGERLITLARLFDEFMTGKVKELGGGPPDDFNVDNEASTDKK